MVSTAQSAVSASVVRSREDIEIASQAPAYLRIRGGDSSNGRTGSRPAFAGGVHSTLGPRLAYRQQAAAGAAPEGLARGPRARRARRASA
jgi:hypothetical protein